jgi:hypothetical protein
MKKTNKELEQTEGHVWVRAVYTEKKKADDGSDVITELPDETTFLPARQFPDGVQPARVFVSNAMKLNMGNYESAEVQCGVSLPCLTEEVQACFTEAWDIARNQLRPQLERLKAVRDRTKEKAGQKAEQKTEKKDRW